MYILACNFARATVNNVALMPARGDLAKPRSAVSGLPRERCKAQSESCEKPPSPASDSKLTGSIKGPVSSASVRVHG